MTNETKLVGFAIVSWTTQNLSNRQLFDKNSGDDFFQCNTAKSKIAIISNWGMRGCKCTCARHDHHLQRFVLIRWQIHSMEGLQHWQGEVYLMERLIAESHQTSSASNITVTEGPFTVSQSPVIVLTDVSVNPTHLSTKSVKSFLKKIQSQQSEHSDFVFYYVLHNHYSLYHCTLNSHLIKCYNCLPDHNYIFYPAILWYIYLTTGPQWKQVLNCIV